MSSSRKEGPRPCCSPATTKPAAAANTTTTTHSTLADSTEKLEIEDKDGEKDADTETNTTETNTETDTATENSDFGSSEEVEEEGGSPVNLDRVLSGPCSICGSPDHHDEDCDEEPDPRYLMTTALPCPHTSDDTSHLPSSSSCSGEGDQNGHGGSQNSHVE